MVWNASSWTPVPRDWAFRRDAPGTRIDAERPLIADSRASGRHRPSVNIVDSRKPVAAVARPSNVRPVRPGTTTGEEHLASADDLTNPFGSATLLVVADSSLSKITASARASVDDTEWPILVATLRGRVLSADAYRALLREIHARALSRAHSFVLLMDVIGTPKPDALCRKTIAEEMECYMKEDQRRLCGVGLVVGPSLHQGVVTAINWRVHPPYPMTVFQDLPAARQWAHQRISAGAVVVRGQ